MAKKAITPIVSIVILLIIVVALAGAAFTYIGGYSELLTSSALEITSIVCSQGTANIIIKNIGTDPIQLSQSVQAQAYSTDANTIGLYHLDEAGAGSCTPSGDACDSMGTLHGTYAKIGAHTLPVPGAAKFGDYGLDMNEQPLPQNNYVNIPDDSSLDLSNTFTIEAWIDIPDPNPDILPLFTKITSSGENGYKFAVDGTQGNVLSFIFGYRDLPPPNPAVPVTVYSSPTKPVPVTGWAHVAVTFDPNRNTGEFFIDGESAGTFSYSNNIIDNDQPLLIGASPHVAPLHFAEIDIDEVRVSDAVRVFTPYMCSVSGSDADCGSFTVSKNSGQGAFGPGLTKSTVNPGQTVSLKDRCEGSSCSYSIISGGRALSAFVQC